MMTPADGWLTLNKTENAFSPSLPEMLFNTQKNKISQNTNPVLCANAKVIQWFKIGGKGQRDAREWTEKEAG